MYNTVKAAVRFNSETSSFFNSNIGVKQGDPSSTILFLYFINDITNNFNCEIEGLFKLNDLSLYILLFADDAVLFAHTPTALQSLLNDLSRYCESWGLNINTKKTNAMIFELGRHTTYNFTLNTIPLNVVTSFKYLGINLFKNGNINRTQKKLAHRSYFALHNLFIILNQLDLDIKEQCRLFDSLVGSILNYGAEIIGDHECKDIEQVHCKFLRKILCVRKSTNLDGLYGETGRYPMKIHRTLTMFKFWIKVLKLNNQTLIKTMYSILQQDADENKTYNGNNWAYRIKVSLNELGLQQLWLHQHEWEIKLDTIKIRILDIYKQTWLSNITNSNRLSLYSTYKQHFELEPYLHKLYIDKYRIALTKFRLSSHNLQIEKGRHEGIARNDRICQNCTMGVIENEYHFLLACPKYYDLRNKLLKPYFCHWPTIHKFKSLLSTTNINELINLSKYIYFAFKRRNIT